MVLSSVVLAILCAATSATAQSLFSRQSDFPPCAIPCLQNANLGNCPATDNVCLCNNAEFVTSTTACIESACTGADLSAAEALAEALCAAVVQFLCRKLGQPQSAPYLFFLPISRSRTTQMAEGAVGLKRPRKPKPQTQDSHPGTSPHGYQIHFTSSPPHSPYILRSVSEEDPERRMREQERWVLQRKKIELEHRQKMDLEREKWELKQKEDKEKMDLEHQKWESELKEIKLEREKWESEQVKMYEEWEEGQEWLQVYELDAARRLMEMLKLVTEMRSDPVMEKVAEKLAQLCKRDRNHTLGLLREKGVEPKWLWLHKGQKRNWGE